MKSAKDKAASKMATLAELLSIRQVSGTFGTRVSRSDNVGEVNWLFDQDVSVQDSDESTRIRIRTEFHLFVKQVQVEAEPVAWVQASYDLDYHYSDIKTAGITETDLIEFGEATAVFNAWPYLREFVHSSMSRMDLPRMTLPLLTRQPAEAPNKDQFEDKKHA